MVKFGQALSDSWSPLQLQVVASDNEDIPLTINVIGKTQRAVNLTAQPGDTVTLEFTAYDTDADRSLITVKHNEVLHEIKPLGARHEVLLGVNGPERPVAIKVFNYCCRDKVFNRVLN